MSGQGHITETFERARAEKRGALILYLTLGHPTPERSLAAVETAVAAGADIIELGIPFSDPLADGPVIQRAAQVALQQGITTRRCLGMAAELRERGIVAPLLFMGYYNPILAYGEEAFCRACRESGVDGLIVPDLPPEEGTTLEELCHREGLALVYLLAPTSPRERIEIVTTHSTGFVYLVSVTGVTGARESLPDELGAFVQRVRAATTKPLAIGFGISTPTQARQAAALADGVIVGSALVRVVGEEGAERSLVTELKKAVAPASKEKPGEQGTPGKDNP